ncbi:MAG: hypothetical protein QNJ00_02405 [Woeseiaceae bacterium]|nr:hypothetical protein [Woeseiaceae bacterium]
MSFQGPASADLANVTTLNQAFLEALAGNDPGIAVPASIAERLRELGGERRTRLARAPFLLMAVGEDDPVRWLDMPRRPRTGDLLRTSAIATQAGTRIAAATVAYLWQLSRANPYAARVVSGASLDWCEQLAGAPLYEVVDFALNEPGLLSLRFAGDSGFWDRLLTAGTSSEKTVRRAARICAVQTLLTRSAGQRYQRLASAACALPAPPSRVADRELS